jgi:hypothetical protein
VGIVDYIDNDGVMRILEQNWGSWNGDWLRNNAIRLWWYKWKEAVAGFILK